jgi:hypothetical protein
MRWIFLLSLLSLLAVQRADAGMIIGGSGGGGGACTANFSFNGTSANFILAGTSSNVKLSC